MHIYEVQEAVTKLPMDQYVPVRHIASNEDEVPSVWLGINKMSCVEHKAIFKKHAHLLVKRFAGGPKCKEIQCPLLESPGCIIQDPSLARIYLERKAKNTALASSF